MPGTTIKINSEQRNGVYELLRNHIGSVGELLHALEHESDFAKAERLSIEFEEDFRLLKDIGWSEDDGRPEFELTMPPHDLMEVLQRLHGEAGEVLSDTEESPEDAETKRLFIQGQATCKRLLADLDPRAGERG